MGSPLFNVNSVDRDQNPRPRFVLFANYPFGDFQTKLGQLKHV